ncbi:MAG: guanylate kinase [Leptolyngbyaceae cyanobacterium SM1_1_3]|nr:guanylate kinase [Leptolyngbyaceae cyanobacterium SM1_1_3]NJN03657.1 guanylate kinase [Leptolyngbyaceae cyanobacterium RM1_1_2]NJO09121.1 guanylate kinase [Leptolyngbyaceae cyanobacterium SL_1_1]
MSSSPVSPLPNSVAPVSSTKPGKLVVFTGPSGVGKGTLLQQLLERHPEIHLSISATTRQPRPGEAEGQHYYFVGQDTFKQMVAAGQLLEWAEFAGNYYGTPSEPVYQQIEAGRWVVLEIELEGARQIQQTYPEALRIFILPPSLAELEKRLRARSQDSEAAIARRLQRARIEVAAADEFDIQIVNDSLDQALQQLEQALFDG